ncbi:MAG: hypothetical protein OXI16_11660 [Chloroflexota bacterium]|nr:hypothetical protein [Chloroflexota bacterium]
MLTDYIVAAMRQAEYKVLEDDTYIPTGVKSRHIEACGQTQTA